MSIYLPRVLVPSFALLVALAHRQTKLWIKFDKIEVCKNQMLLDKVGENWGRLISNRTRINNFKENW